MVVTVGETACDPDSVTEPSVVMLTVSAFVTSQLSVEDWPLLITGGTAVKEIILAVPLRTRMLTLAVPFAPRLSVTVSRKL